MGQLRSSMIFTGGPGDRANIYKMPPNVRSLLRGSVNIRQLKEIADRVEL